MKVFSATYGDQIKYDAKPNEDFFLISETRPIFAVADGVTQSHFPDGTYAFADGARQAAEIFCKETVKSLEAGLSMTRAFDEANQKIKELNLQEEMDKKLNYVEYDWFDTVGVAAIIENNKLFYGFVGDCGLAIFDKNNINKFQTKDMVAPAVARFAKQFEKHGRIEPRERTTIIHRDFRNNPNKKGYGSFSGEEGVKNYYKFGSKKLKTGDIAVLFSDGMFWFLKDKDFLQILRGQNKQKLDEFIAKKATDNPERYGSDRTFIAIEY